MISDSIINASIPNAPKDFCKKKRVNRSAKLKQCKLDARREQWLSQVKNKGPKDQERGNGGGNGESNLTTIGTRKTKGKKPCCKGVEMRSVSGDMIHSHDSDSEESSIGNSPSSSLNYSGNNYVRLSGSSASSSSAGSLSFGSGGYCSGSITEEEEGARGEFGDDDGCLDDWEAVADALVGAEANDKQGHVADRLLGEDSRSIPDPDSVNQQAQIVVSERREIPGTARMNNKAWRSDDAFRPQSLPNLSKHWSFPANSERISCHGVNPWVHKMPPSVPTACPICCEDLDLTDSSFCPCPCGFHLCLFCHKRILEEDARCPGCRKPYVSEVDEKEISETGGGLTVRLARSCSMFSRV